MAWKTCGAGLLGYVLGNDLPQGARMLVLKLRERQRLWMIKQKRGDVVTGCRARSRLPGFSAGFHDLPAM